MALLSGRQFFINYAPELELSLTCVRVQKYEVASPEFDFEGNCRVREELPNIQRDTGNSAALKNIGEMYAPCLTYRTAFSCRLSRTRQQARWIKLPGQPNSTR